MYNFNKLCNLGARMVEAPPGVDPEALLRAMGKVESSSGRNNVSRHENSYCRGGKYFNRTLYRKFGCDAHCSYGPWQIMYANVSQITAGEISPVEMHDPQVALIVTVEWLNRKVIARGADTVSKIGDAWNSGSHKDKIVPTKYIAKLLRAYDESMVNLVREAT